MRDVVTNLFMFGPEAGSLSADLTPVGSTGRQLEVVQKDVLSGGFRPLENILFAGNLYSRESPLTSTLIPSWGKICSLGRSFGTNLRETGRGTIRERDLTRED